MVWSGSTWHENDHNRSLLLYQLKSLLLLPVEFHSLQKEVREIDLKTLIDFPKINQHQDDLIDFSDTAALIDEMDIIISVDTAVAHLSGAMGKKTFILVESYRNEKELFNLQCWALTCESFFEKEKRV